jgi:hypothetical protein
VLQKESFSFSASTSFGRVGLRELEIRSAEIVPQNTTFSLIFRRERNNLRVTDCILPLMNRFIYKRSRVRILNLAKHYMHFSTRQNQRKERRMEDKYPYISTHFPRKVFLVLRRKGKIEGALNASIYLYLICLSLELQIERFCSCFVFWQPFLSGVFFLCFWKGHVKEEEANQILWILFTFGKDQ